MKKIVFAFFLASCAIGNVSAKEADIVEQVLGCKEDPCVIKYYNDEKDERNAGKNAHKPFDPARFGNMGGRESDYTAAIKAIQKGARKRIIVDGPCYSFCVTLIDVLRDKVCFTDRGSVGVHQLASIDGKDKNGRVILDPNSFHDPEFSKDITALVKASGGYLPNREITHLPMSGVTKIWKACPGFYFGNIKPLKPTN